MSKYTDTKKYTSSYNIKDFALNVIGPKYFPEDVIEGYNIGLLGYTLDLFANTTEDIFNTVPIVVNEMFPNLAEMPSATLSFWQSTLVSFLPMKYDTTSSIAY